MRSGPCGANRGQQVLSFASTHGSARRTPASCDLTTCFAASASSASSSKTSSIGRRFRQSSVAKYDLGSPCVGAGGVGGPCAHLGTRVTCFGTWRAGAPAQPSSSSALIPTTRIRTRTYHRAARVAPCVGSRVSTMSPVHRGLLSAMSPVHLPPVSPVFCPLERRGKVLTRPYSAIIQDGEWVNMSSKSFASPTRGEVGGSARGGQRAPEPAPARPTRRGRVCPPTGRTTSPCV